MDDIKCIARLRLRAQNLDVESDRSTSRYGRICRCCDMVVDGRRVEEDEMHFMLECPLYPVDRFLIARGPKWCQWTALAKAYSWVVSECHLEV